MESFARRRKVAAGEEKRERILDREADRGIYSDRLSRCFVFDWGHSRTFAGLLCAGHSAFSFVHVYVYVCVWLNRALMRGVLCSAACLFPFLSLIYCNVGLCGGEPAGRLAYSSHKSGRWNISIYCMCLRDFCWMPSGIGSLPSPETHVQQLGALLSLNLVASLLLYLWCVSPKPALRVQSCGPHTSRDCCS